MGETPEETIITVKKGKVITWADERAPTQFGNANSVGGNKTVRNGCVTAQSRDSVIIGNFKRSAGTGEGNGLPPKMRGSPPRIENRCGPLGIGGQQLLRLQGGHIDGWVFVVAAILESSQMCVWSRSHTAQLLLLKFF